MLKCFAERVRAAHRAFADEACRTMREVIDGVCMHCDMHDACQQGEDGMPTRCNAVSNAMHFIERHEQKGGNGDLPF